MITKSDPFVIPVTGAPDAANIKADGTTNQVTVQNVSAYAMVKVYVSFTLGFFSCAKIRIRWWYNEPDAGFEETCCWADFTSGLRALT